MPKIGVGITTTSKRPEHKAHWENLIAFGSLCEGMKVHFAHDVFGIAKAKNECLRNLQDCDFVFLFDDDTFPIAEGWADHFINAHHRIGCHSFSYLHNYGDIRRVGSNKDVSIYSNAAGCMLFLTRDAIERVGSFNEAYGLYGYEHADYSERVKLSGLAPHRNICPDNSQDYIYSMDLDSWKTFDFKHKSTLTISEMKAAHEVSVVEWMKPEPIIYLPL